MDQNIQSVIEKRVQLVIENLKKNNMNGYYVKSNDELMEQLNKLVKDDEIVSVGGSMTLFETGVIEYLRNRQVTFLDRYAPGLTGEDITKIYQDTFSCDSYFASTNAITEKGELYNVDGNGNRVAAMIWGPKKVVLIVGTNKIVHDIDDAIKRNRRVAAPANVARLDRKTPCLTTGYCTDCNSPEKICRAYSVITGQGNPDRMHIIFVDGNYGY